MGVEFIKQDENTLIRRETSELIVSKERLLVEKESLEKMLKQINDTLDLLK